MKTKTKPKEPEFVFRKRDAWLTPQERKVLDGYARGLTYAETADEIGIGSKTVASYLQRVREKCRAKTKADVIAFAIAEGLLAN